MKFIETLNGSFANVDDIAWVGHEICDKTNRYYSYIHLKNGYTLDFLDIIDQFEDDFGKIYKFNCDHLISWHRHAIQILCETEDMVISLDDLMDKSWVLFIKEFQNKGKKNEKSRNEA